MATRHFPVLLKETIDLLAPGPDQNFIDATLGGGGHAEEILKRIGPNGKLLAIDLDELALKTAKNNLLAFKDKIIFVRENFAKIKQIYNEHFSTYKISGILLDLGLSSLELEDERRGFSFQIDSALDMRFDTRASLTAAEIVNNWPFDKLKKVIQEYGQEALAPKITQEIISLRQHQKITKTKKLVEAILLAFRNTLGSKKDVPWIGGLHPATRTFQALRLAVNNELDNLKKVLPQCLEILQPGGRLAVISFHSLEDKLVKDFFKAESRDCICPPEFPVCRCGHKASLKILTKKPVVPSEVEITCNPRSRSAKLRAVMKI